MKTSKQQHLAMLRHRLRPECSRRAASARRSADAAHGRGDAVVGMKHIWL